MSAKLLFAAGSCMYSLLSFSQIPDWSWAKSLGGTNESHGLSVAIDHLDNVYTTGYFRGTVDFDPGPGIYELTTVGTSIAPDIFVCKLDALGNLVWVKAMGGTTHGIGLGQSIVLDAEGNSYTTGYYGGPVDFDPGAGTFELTGGGVFILKLDASGDFVWALGMGDTSADEARSIALDASGNVYTTGRFYGTADFDPGAGTFILTSATPTYSDLFISKLDASGQFVWAKAIGGSTLDYSNSVAIDESGNVYTTGRFDGTVDFDPGIGEFNLIDDGSGDTFILKLDGSGNFVWAVSMGVNGNTTEGYSIAIDPGGSGDIYITRGGSISKFDSQGNLIWTKVMGGTGEDFVSVGPEGSTDIYITGYFYDSSDFDPSAEVFNLISAGNADIFISKLDDSGNFLWAKAAGGTGDDYSRSLALNASGHVYLTGYFESPSITFGSDTLVNVDNTGMTTDVFIAKLDASTTSIDIKDEQQKKIVIYPNPATDHLTILSAESGYGNMEMVLYNILGEVVLSEAHQNIGHGIEIDISTLSTGIYFVQIDLNGIKGIKKICREK